MIIGSHRFLPCIIFIYPRSRSANGRKLDYSKSDPSSIPDAVALSSDTDILGRRPAGGVRSAWPPQIR